MSHQRNVMSLYRRLLRLQQKLPKELAEVGVVYIQQEFKQHREVNDDKIIKQFMDEWKAFAVTMETQLAFNEKLGQKIKSNDLDYLSDQQLGQLFELYQETKKPIK